MKYKLLEPLEYIAQCIMITKLSISNAYAYFSGLAHTKVSICNTEVRIANFCDPNKLS